MSKPESPAWRRIGIPVLLFAIIFTGYVLSFSYDENDSLDTVYWTEHGEIRTLLEFRHLVQRMLPLWLWQFLNHAGISVGAKAVLNYWDFTTAALSVMLLYCILFDLVRSRPLAFGGSFAYATAHCIWIYVGSGRLYSTSMFLVFAGYYLALRMDKVESEGRRWWLVFGAATHICFSALFWLTHFFNAIGVGLLLLFRPEQKTLMRRFSYLAAYAAIGLVLTTAIGTACLRYVEIPLSKQPIKDWMASAGTQPMQFDALSPMKAAFGQAHGILVMYELPYMINGLMLKDQRLAHMASLPWQLAKFILVWLLLILVYLYPFYLFWKGDTRRRLLLFALCVPLAINAYFGIGWLGSDVQRFMPTMLSQFALAVLSVQDLLSWVPRPRLVAGLLIASLAFIGGANLLESLLPSYSRYRVLEAEMKTIQPYLHRQDLPINFGRDVSITYLTMSNLYAGARFLNTTNDYTKYAWDRRDWQDYFRHRVQDTEKSGGRIFVMDRFALGLNPTIAAWSEIQHPHPSLKEFSEFLRNEYCLQPSFVIESSRYYEVSARSAACPANALAPVAENRP